MWCGIMFTQKIKCFENGIYKIHFVFNKKNNEIQDKKLLCKITRNWTKKETVNWEKKNLKYNINGTVSENKNKINKYNNLTSS